MSVVLPSIAQLLDLARRAAETGAHVIGAPLPRASVTVKGAPGDLVTELDVTAERRVREFLSSARPDDRIVGEELDEDGGADAALRWSIDPLDGTTNKIKGLPHYATSVAVQSTSTGRWLAGAVHAPELNREYFAGRGAGAFRRAGRTAEKLSGPDPDSGSRLLGTGFSYDPAVRTGQISALDAFMKHFDDMRSIGSAALGLCAVAEGAVDAFVESDLYEFDWAAGALIAEEAGATVERPAAHRGGIVAYVGRDFRG